MLTPEDDRLIYECYIEKKRLGIEIREREAELVKLKREFRGLSNNSIAEKFEIYKCTVGDSIRRSKYRLKRKELAESDLLAT